MHESWDNFNKYLDKDSFAQAFKLKNELQEAKYTEDDLTLQVHTKKVYQG